MHGCPTTPGDGPGLSVAPLPEWLPRALCHYLRHTGGGVSLRALARAAGCHPSTVLRQVRRIEQRRDDPLADAALDGLRALAAARPAHLHKECRRMTSTARKPELPDNSRLESEARRILAPMADAGCFLAVAPAMERAVLLRDRPGDDGPERLAVVDRSIAQAFVLKDWIGCRTAGRVARYTITAAGRAALRRLLAGDRARARPGATGFAEAASPFAAQHGEHVLRDLPGADGAAARRVLCNLAETPLGVLARRRDGAGRPFLSPELLAAGERLREDFELAQMGPRVTQNWERFLVAGSDAAGAPADRGQSDGARAARERLQAALADLGPGLGDIALRCCCYLEGLEAAERRMGWSARSGKIVLRIALQRLRRHYEARYGRWGPMIG